MGSRISRTLALTCVLMIIGCKASALGHDAGRPADASVLGSCASLPGTPKRIVGHITADTTLGCDQLYLFSGTVVVDEPATLTVMPGTTIIMSTDGSLIVRPGAKLMAIGTRDQPIVFTSAHLPGTRMPGDWGAIALLGRAPGNWGASNGVVVTEHAPDANDWPGGFPYVAGGDNPTDSSGTLKYVRIEYGGAPSNATGATQHEMLGLYGVGSGTTIEYVDMRQGGFGCLFAEGGAFSARHLICQWGGNTAFGFSRGNQSRAQFLFDQENPAQGAEGLGIKGPFDVNLLAPMTDPTIYNVTVCGANGSPLPNKDSFALFMRRQPAGHVFNFIGTGFRAGLAMNGSTTATAATTELHSAVLFGNFDVNVPNTNIAYPNGLDPFYPTGNDIDLSSWFATPAWVNSVADPGIAGCFDATAPRAAPAATLAANASTPPHDGFFDSSAAYLGAFKDQRDTWASGAWVVWGND
jgi:hypothetical protein